MASFDKEFLNLYARAVLQMDPAKISDLEPRMRAPAGLGGFGVQRLRRSAQAAYAGS